MDAKITLDELAERTLGSKINHALQEVDVESSDTDLGEPVLSIDDLARRYLAQNAFRAINKVNFEKEEIGIGIEAKEFRAQVHARGLSLLLVVLSLIALVLGLGPVLTLLRTVTGG